MSTTPRAGRRLVAALTTALLAVGLAACGSTAPSEPAAEAAAPRKVVDATGAEVSVPAAPKKVVVLTQEDLDAALALGVKPAGITNGQGLTTPPAYLGDRIAGVPVVGDLLRPVMDKVVQAEPDVILAGDMTDKQVLEQLRKIAPATLVTMTKDDDWKEHLVNVAKALNAENKVAGVLADYDRKIAEVKGGLGAAGSALVSIVRWNPQGPSFMEKGQFASSVVADLGLRRPDAQRVEGTAHSQTLSLEALDKIDGDWLFLSTLTADGEQALATVRSTPAFQQLKAVKANHVVTVPGSVWTTRGAPLAAMAVADDVRKALTGS